MKTVVCDASPLIFLAKADRLNLVGQILGTDVFLLERVRREFLVESASVVERQRLTAFLEGVEIVDFVISERRSNALSVSDQSTLTWAAEHQVDWLVADDRVMRRVAKELGIATMGFAGLLIASTRQGIQTSEETRQLLDQAIANHGYRISVALYQEIQVVLDQTP